jgi:TonB family protein
LIVMRAFLFCCALMVASPVLALTPNLPAGSLGPNMIVQTRLGPMANCVVYAPRPVIPPAGGDTRGVYAIDIAVSTGYVYSARVLQSSGNKFVDEAVLDTLRTWRIRPRSIYKLIIPIKFHGRRVTLGATR